MLDPVADPHKMNGSETLIYSKEVITAIAGRGGGNLINVLNYRGKRWGKNNTNRHRVFHMTISCGGILFGSSSGQQNLFSKHCFSGVFLSTPLIVLGNTGNLFTPDYFRKNHFTKNCFLLPARRISLYSPFILLPARIGLLAIYTDYQK
jgi:hypothetical protein